jgi:hypothetical protein
VVRGDRYRHLAELLRRLNHSERELRVLLAPREVGEMTGGLE